MLLRRSIWKIKKVVHLPYLREALKQFYWRLPASWANRFYRWGTYDPPLRIRSPEFWEDFGKTFDAVKANGVTGDFLEFGVFQGRSFVDFYEMAGEFGMGSMRFFAFDSFTGMPQTEGNKIQGSTSASVEVFTKEIRRVGIDMRRVKIVEGEYANSLNDDVLERHGLTNAAIVHMDCDQYKSVKDALRFIGPIVHPGSVVIFGDWHYYETVYPVEHPEDIGEQKAFWEWPLSTLFEELWDNGFSRAFIMRKLERV